MIHYNIWRELKKLIDIFIKKTFDLSARIEN